MPRQTSSYRFQKKARNTEVSDSRWTNTPGTRNLDPMTASHLRDTQDIQELSVRKSQARARVLRRNGGRYMLPRSPTTPTTMGIEKVHSCQTPDAGRFHDYVSTEGTAFFLPAGRAPRFNAPPVSCLEVAPFQAKLQVDSSPSTSCSSVCFCIGFHIYS